MDVVLVIGAGPVGAMHVLLNKIAGAKKVIVADIRDDRLETIREFGADVTINSSQVSLEDAVLAETDSRGADVIITALSIPEIQTQAIGLLATHGRVNFFGGLGKNVLVPIDTNRVHYKGLHLLGTTGSTHSDYFKSLTLVAEGRAKLRRLITATFSLSEIVQGFEYSASGKGMKATILFDGSKE
jgi:threonine dehydrogenase-like Zn-dependent dehydrogenase